MELRYMEEFVELARLLNFTSTAKAMHIAQPTLSKHLAMIENELGVELFVRNSNSMELTEEGLAFLSTVHNILREYQLGIESIEAIRSRQNIIVDGRIDDDQIASLLAIASDTAHKQLSGSLMLNHSRAKASLTLLLDGNIDLLIDIQPSSEKLPDTISSLPLFRRPFVVIIDLDHPLASRDSISIADLKYETFIKLLWDNFTPGWDTIERVCLKHGFEPKVRQKVVRSLAESLLVTEKDCILIHSRNVKELSYIENTGLKKVLPVDDPDAYFEIGALYLSSSKECLSPMLSIFSEIADRIQLANKA